nr:MAK10-like protein [Tanacetum cinerariifolium]
MGDANSIRTIGDYCRPSHEGYRNTIVLPKGNNVVPLRSDTIRLVQNGCSFYGLRSEDPNLKDFLKLVDSLNLDVANRERTCLRLFKFSLRDQASNWLEPYLAPKQPTQVNKITSSCEICSSPHDTQYCMEYPKQAFVDYASSCTDEAGGKWYTFNPEQNNLDDTYNPSWKSHPNLK